MGLAGDGADLKGVEGTRADRQQRTGRDTSGEKWIGIDWQKRRGEEGMGMDSLEWSGVAEPAETDRTGEKTSGKEWNVRIGPDRS